MSIGLLFTSIIILIGQANCMHVFAAGEYLNIKVNGLRSSKTLVSYDYYSLPFPKVNFVVSFYV